MASWSHGSDQFNYGYSQESTRPISNLFDMKSFPEEKYSLPSNDEIGERNTDQNVQSYNSVLQYSNNFDSKSREMPGTVLEATRIVCYSRELNQRGSYTNFDSNTIYPQSYWNEKHEERFSISDSVKRYFTQNETPQNEYFKDKLVYSSPAWSEVFKMNNFGRSPESEAKNSQNRTISNLFNVPYEEKCQQISQKPQEIYASLAKDFDRPYERKTQNSLKRTISDLFDFPCEEKCQQFSQKPHEIYSSLAKGFDEPYESRTQNSRKRTISDLFDVPCEEKCQQISEQCENNYGITWRESLSQEILRNNSYKQSYQDRYALINKSTGSTSLQEPHFPDRLRHEFGDMNNYKKYTQSYGDGESVSCEPYSTKSNFGSENRGFYNVSGHNQTNDFRVQDKFKREGNQKQTEFADQKGQFETAGQKTSLSLSRTSLTARRRDKQKFLSCLSAKKLKKSKSIIIKHLSISKDLSQTQQPKPFNEGNAENKLVEASKDFMVNQYQSFIQKYLYYPPSAEEMGKIFEGMVIYFYFNTNALQSVPETDPYLVILDSFTRSDRFTDLEDEIGHLLKKPQIKCCTLRWLNMMMVRGVCEGKAAKARVRAGIELINKLAMSCYSLKIKMEYCDSRSIKQILDNREGLYRIISKSECPSEQSACDLIADFFKKDSDRELVFQNKTLLLDDRWYKTLKDYEFRVINKSWLSVFKKRTPQYWRDKILASGKMENEKFILIPPQGFGKHLLDLEIFKKSPIMKRCETSESTLQNVYGPDGVGPSIVKKIRGDDKKLTKRRRKRAHKQKVSIKKVEHFREPLSVRRMKMQVKKWRAKLQNQSS